MIEPFVNNVLPVIMLEHESSSSVDGNLYPYCLASVDVDWGSTFELQLLMVSSPSVTFGLGVLCADRTGPQIEAS